MSGLSNKQQKAWIKSVEGCKLIWEDKTGDREACIVGNPVNIAMDGFGWRFTCIAGKEWHVVNGFNPSDHGRWIKPFLWEKELDNLGDIK